MASLAGSGLVENSKWKQISWDTEFPMILIFPFVILISISIPLGGSILVTVYHVFTPPSPNLVHILEYFSMSHSRRQQLYATPQNNRTELLNKTEDASEDDDEYFILKFDQTIMKKINDVLNQNWFI